MTALGRSPRDGVVRLRSNGSTRGSTRGGTGQLSIPAHMTRMIPKDALFRAEWHDDGILFRFLGVSSEDADAVGGSVPVWVRVES